MKRSKTILPAVLCACAAAFSPVRADAADNPLVWADIPDLSMIRVGDTYYMSSTTMHFNPGVPIMKSKDLVNWKICSYAYDILDDTDKLALRNGESDYGKGTWASSIRHHDDMFYVSTFSYDTGRTHVYRTKDPEKGKWEANSFSPLFHDHSLFFDDDGRVYMIHGHKDIFLEELKSDLSGVKEDGIRGMRIIEDAAKPAGEGMAEGSQLFKINGKYYLFNICWPPGKCRTVVVHRADKITGPWEGRVALQDKGVAQGGLIDTPDGKWYAYLFRDSGPVGRIPYLVPVEWKDGWPVLGVNGEAPMKLDIAVENEEIPSVVRNDEFKRPKKLLERLKKSGKTENDYCRAAFPLQWQWNHNPDNRFWSLTERPGWLRLKTMRTDKELVDARNTLTQRSFGPASEAWTLVDASGMTDGDVAGICALQWLYGYAAVEVRDGKRFIVMGRARKIAADKPENESAEEITVESVPLEGSKVWLKARCDFEPKNEASFYYSLDGKTWTKIGDEVRMEYSLRHFVGYRFGLFCFAKEKEGGFADFDFFRIGKPQD